MTILGTFPRDRKMIGPTPGWAVGLWPSFSFSVKWADVKACKTLIRFGGGVDLVLGIEDRGGRESEMYKEKMFAMQHRPFKNKHRLRLR